MTTVISQVGIGSSHPTPIIEAYGPGGQEKSRCPTGSRGLRELRPLSATGVCTGRVREAKETPRWIQMAALHEGVEASLNGLAQWHDQRSVNIGKICSKTLFHERG